MKTLSISIVFGIAFFMAIPAGEALADPTAAIGSIGAAFALGNSDAALAGQKTALLKMKRDGKTMWGSEKWMKSPAYYASLSTTELAKECFEKPLFGIELGVHDDDRFGLQDLQIMHNGFAELFGRDDMWKGILAVYDDMSSKISPENDLMTIVAVDNNFEKMGALYRWPAFSKQVEGREGIFLAANLRAVKRYRWYLDNYDPKKLGTSMPFFCEPCSVAKVALMLAERVDPQRSAEIASAIHSVTWPRVQRMEDVKNYLDLVITSLAGVVADEYRLRDE